MEKRDDTGSDEEQLEGVGQQTTSKESRTDKKRSRAVQTGDDSNGSDEESPPHKVLLAAFVQGVQNFGFV